MSATNDNRAEPSIPGANAYTGNRRALSLALLLIVNVIPVYGVLFLGWDVASLLVLYWSENLVLGFYTILKMLVTAPLGGLFGALFFTIHYGGFCAVHGLFIMTMLVDGDLQFLEGDTWPLWLVFVQLLVDVVRQVLAYAPPAWLIAFAGLLLSHGVSFIVNFLLAGERRTSNVKTLMGAPYGRIVITHVTVLFGGFAVMALGQPIAMLLILVVLKTVVDVRMHLREHRKLATATST